MALKATAQPHHDDLLSPRRSAAARSEAPRWERLLRGGSGSRRQDRPGQFYPVYVDPETKRITGVGDALPEGEDPDLAEAAGKTVAWPLRTDGSQGRYQTTPKALRQLLSDGYVKLGGFDPKRNTWTVLYLNASARRRIKDGTVKITGRDLVTGAVELAYSAEESRKVSIKTVWHRGLHDSGIYGSALLKAFIGRDVEFAFPKSLYAVEDALGAVVRNNREALVLDFFAGSGTTLHALLRLNATDGGSRRCILVTNNEVESELADKMSRDGLSPGDPAYDAHGIANAVTWPRCSAAILGHRPDNAPIPGEYDGGTPFADGFNENAAYFKLGFLDPAEVSRGESFESIVPILWMFAGCKGPCETSKGVGKWFIPKRNPYAVLLKEDAFGDFRSAIASRPDITHVFLVTNSTDSFHDMAGIIGKSKRCVQLYRSYLDTFRINLPEPATITSGGVLAIAKPAVRGARDAV